MAVALGCAQPAIAQTPAQKTMIADTWQGTLHLPGHDLRTIETQVPVMVIDNAAKASAN
jgi:hypothetical protein